MPKKFTSFEEFGKHVQIKKEAEKDLELKERFELILRGKFDYFPPGNFTSTIDSVDSISIIRPLPSQRTGKVESLSVVVYFTLGKKEGHETLTLASDGSLIGRLPERLGVKNAEILEDVLHTAETIDLEFFEFVGDDILPDPEREAGKTGGGGGVEGKGGGPALIDPRRLAFMRNQKKVLFGVAGSKKGFGGYYGFIFQDRVVLENPRVKNAVYIFSLREPINVPPGRFKLSPEKRLRKEERKEFIDGEWKDIAGLTKPEARAKGAKRIYHPEINDEEWEKRMQVAIDRKMELLGE